MRTLLQDLRYGLRMLRKTPGFTLVALVSLALGIGVNTAIFSLVNAVLLRPVPVVRGQGRIVWLRAPSSYPDFLDYRERARSLEGMTAVTGTSEFSLNSGGESELVTGEFVSANYFDVLGVAAARGRTFAPEEDRTPAPVVVLAHQLWRTRFGSDPSVVGRQINLNGLGFTVVGVAPEKFIGTEVGLDRELWVPLSMHPVLYPPAAKASAGREDLFGERNSHWLRVFARLREGVSREQAGAELTNIARAVAEAHYGRADAEALRRVELLRMSGGMDPGDREQALPVAGMMMAVVGLVLLIACANLGGLLVARAAVRRRETAIRQALGAGRLRLVRQWLTESVLLGVLGGALGLLLALWGNDLMVAYAQGTPLAALDLGIDYRVLAFTSAASVATGVVFGLAPALQASRLDIVTALKSEDALGHAGARRSRLRAAFVAAQVALSAVLLVGAGLFIRSLQSAHSIDPGFRVERALTVPVNLGLLRYEEGEGRGFYRELLARVGALAGVESASLVRFPPLGFSYAQGQVFAEGRELRPGEEGTTVGFNVVGPGYLRTMGTPLLRGREFAEADRAGAPGVAVVSEALADALWPGQDALGKRLSFEGTRGPFLEVVGVARDVKYRSLGDAARPYLYLPVLQSYEPRMTLVVRTEGEPQALAGAVREQVRALDANLPVADVRTLGEQLALSLLPSRAAAWTLGGFGLLALALAAIGIYGVVSYAVAQRTREIGVRVALGAQRRDVLRLVMGEGMLVVGLGVAAGLLLSLAATRVVAGFLYGVGATDPLTFAGVPLLLGAIALAAGYLPARRAAKVDPAVALRHE
ncbi:MAG TPA: ABC transporter permease [Pyrinomonadaceae bacterium]|nr:ABC transporter permease [Pyrinomonadaceae bacterium]